VEAFDGAIGDSSFRPKPMEEQRLMSTQHVGYPFRWFQATAHGPGAPELLPCPPAYPAAAPL